MVTNDTLVEALHASGWQGVLMISGGGTSLISQLCSTPGASRTVLEGLIPYSKSALLNHLKVSPTQFCTVETARAMAVQSFRHAFRLTEGASSAQLFGLGCTANLVSTSPKKGDHRIHAALQTQSVTASSSLILQKGKRTREEEEALAVELSLSLLGKCLKLGECQPSLLPNETIDHEVSIAPVSWCTLFTGETKVIDQLGHQPQQVETPRGIFPGAFNPLHAGHLKMVEHARDLLDCPVEFELCVNNPDKIMLDYYEIQKRIQGFPADSRIWLTSTPTFLEKCRIFPGATFLVGTDTIARVFDSKYYAKQMDLNKVFDEMAKLKCDFLVYGRHTDKGFAVLSDLQIPPALLNLCREVTKAEFMHDLSSSAIRAGYDKKVRSKI